MALGPCAYRSPREREQLLGRWSGRPGCELIAYGTSAEGRPLLALRFARRTPPRANEPDPVVLCCANIHGVEYIGAEVALTLAERILEDRPEAILRDEASVLVIPTLNPDAAHRTWERSGCGTLAELRTNARGVDLNRNYPLPLGSSPSRFPGAGSSQPGRATYRGPHPLSEPETAALHVLLGRHDVRASVNLHSFMGTLIPASVRNAQDYAVYRRLCREFTRAQVEADQGSGYVRLASRRLDVFTGEQEDHQHHAFGTWAVCVECFSWAESLRQSLYARSVFSRFNPKDPRSIVDRDLRGAVAFLRAGLRADRPSATTSDKPRLRVAG